MQRIKQLMTNATWGTIQAWIGELSFRFACWYLWNGRNDCCLTGKKKLRTGHHVFILVKTRCLIQG